MKTVRGIHNKPDMHWVGDGFPVHSLFDYQGLGKQLSPFLLLDHAGPAEFAPATKPRGVGQHPHRGFETVSIVYEGEVAHRDSTGQGGVIGPGDVQWMTAGSGILHEEFHSPAFTQKGGQLHMVQLWVNLPAKDKMTPPGYQAILNAEIPKVEIDNGAATARVIAGEFLGARGAAHTFTPMQVVDLEIQTGHSVTLPAYVGWNTALVILNGKALINQEHSAHGAQLVVFSQEGDALVIEAKEDVKALILSGQPLNEPIVGHGPFVMNTMEEIKQAFVDFQSGGFGRMD
ncbi:MAG: pirin family protein [Betaproteobacteria bacterium]